MEATNTFVNMSGMIAKPASVNEPHLFYNIYNKFGHVVASDVSLANLPDLGFKPFEHRIEPFTQEAIRQYARQKNLSVEALEGIARFLTDFNLIYG